MNCEKFQYRSNADGTIDSICLRCFLTAGSCLASVLTFQNNKIGKILVTILVTDGTITACEGAML
jgi:hypothetical protein